MLWDAASGKEYSLAIKAWTHLVDPKGPAPTEGTRMEVTYHLHNGAPHDLKKSGGGRPSKVSGPRFHNPYSFVPAPPRGGWSDRSPELADHRPADRGRWEDHHYGARLTIRLRTVTPLLLPDLGRPLTADSEHRVHGIDRHPDGTPLLRPTALRGVLRAAYEAITNSRFGIFGNRARVGYRLTTDDAAGLVPARVVAGKDPDAVTIELLRGDQSLTWQASGALKARPFAAPVRAYGPGALPGAGVAANHGAAVDVGLAKSTKGPGWRVMSMTLTGGAAVPTDPLPPTAGISSAAGILVITGNNIGGKTSERVFFGRPLAIPLDAHQTAELRSRWQDRIDDYAAQHRARNGVFRTPTLSASWSRHILDADAERQMPVGTLGYARVVREDGSLRVIDLMPVAIGRQLHDASPRQLVVDSGLLPAESLDELSPADRVFGWVRPRHDRHERSHDTGAGALRSALRVHGVRCMVAEGDPHPIQKIGDRGRGMPLAILSSPKPQQPGFYFSPDAVGSPLPPEADQRSTLATIGGIRGRKVYPHQRGLEFDSNPGHWAPNRRASNRVGGHFGEYVHAAPEGPARRSDQNRSFTEWVRPGTEIVASIDADGLSEVELGALLWLVDMNRDRPSEPPRHLRLGYGKPLGFGSVTCQLEVESSRIFTGAQRRDRWVHAFDDPHGDPGWGLNTPAGKEHWDRCRDAFQAAVARADGVERFEEARWIRAFLAAAEGRAEAPVHYPRCATTGGTHTPPDPEGRSYEWFVENAHLRTGGEALPPLEPSDPGLTAIAPRPRK